MKVPLLQQPQDKWRLAYIICFIEGLGMLFPWNTFITASAYYSTRLCDTSFHHNFENFFGISFNCVNLVGVIVCLNFQHKIRPRLRVLFPLVMCVLVFGVTTLLVTIDHIDGNTLFALTIACVVLAAANISLLQSGFFGLCAQLPPIYTQAVMGGQGLAGAFISVVSLLTSLAASDSNDDDSCVTYSTDWASFAYFLTSCFILFLSFCGYLVLERLPFVIFHTTALDARGKFNTTSSQISKRSAVSINSSDGSVVIRSDDAAPLMASDDDDGEKNSSPYRASLPMAQSSPKFDPLDPSSARSGSVLTEKQTSKSDALAPPSSRRSSGLPDGTSTRRGSGSVGRVQSFSFKKSKMKQDLQPNSLATLPIDTENDNDPLIGKSVPSELEDERSGPMTNWQIFKRVQSLALGVGFVFFITLALFPSVASKIEAVSSSSSKFFTDLWTPWIFLMFNLWDLVGRAILAPWKTFVSPDKLWIVSLARTIFVPLFLLCKLDTSDGGSHYTVFDNDAWPIIFMSIFGLTNGYVSSQLMMYGPMRVGDLPENQLKAGTMMVLFLVSGLTLGSFGSFALLPLT